MKRRSVPIAVMALALIVALGGLGVVYGQWTKDLTVTGTVNTATFDVHFANASVGPDVAGDGTVDCGTLSGDGTADLSSTLDNVSPGHGCTFTADIRNDSTIPVVIQPPKVSLAGNNTAGLTTSSSLTAALPLAESSSSSAQTFTISANDNAKSGDSGTATFTMVAGQASILEGMIQYYTGFENGNFTKSSTPFGGTSQTTQTDNANGSVTVSATNTGAYDDSGFVIYAGKLGNLNTITVNSDAGATNLGLNLWLDLNGDGNYFNWSGSTYQNVGVDGYVSAQGGLSSGTATVDGSTTFANLQGVASLGLPANPTLANLKTAAPNANVAIWVGVTPANNSSAAATINSVTIN